MGIHRLFGQHWYCNDRKSLYICTWLPIIVITLVLQVDRRFPEDKIESYEDQVKSEIEDINFEES